MRVHHSEESKKAAESLTLSPTAHSLDTRSFLENYEPSFLRSLGARPETFPCRDLDEGYLCLRQSAKAGPGAVRLDKCPGDL